jgi:glutathione S-transferase
LQKRLLTGPSRTPQGAIRQRSSGQHQIRAMAGVTQPSDYAFDIYCKGDPEDGNPSLKGQLLDCPFSQWVMLTFEEKGIKYRKQLCNEQELPKFLGDVHPAGKPLIPVIYDHEADKYIGESTDIIKYIEEKYPDPKLGTPDSTSDAGENLFPDVFMNFLLAEGDDEPKAKEELVAEYKKLDEALGKTDGPYLSGKEPCAQCLALAPRIYHISIATARIKNFPIPEEYKNIHAFLKAMKARESWGPTAPVNDDAVEEGWRTKIKSKKEE